MATNDDRPEKPGVPSDVSRRAVLLGGQVGFTTLFIIIGAVFGGLWLDNALGTRPIIMLTLVLGTVPVSLAITYRMARKAVKDYEETRKTANRTTAPSSSAQRSNSSKEGDETGE